MARVDMSRREDLKNKSVIRDGKSYTYDNNGYVVSVVNDGGRSATDRVKTTKANNSPTHQAMYTAAQSGDWDKVGSLADGLISKTKDASGGYDMTAAREYMRELQDEFGYNWNDYYTNVVSKNKGTAGGVAGTQTSGATGGTATGGYGSFNDFLDSMGYDSYEEQTRKYIQAAIDNAVKGYESQIADVNADTKELARQAYVNKMMGEKNLDQQLAAAGMAGGMADSQRIGLQANYENNLVALEQQRADTVRELERAIENARLTGDMQAAQELASYLQQVQGQWNNYVLNQQQMENQNYWNQKNMETDAVNTARNWALTLLENGSMPDDATLTAAGISRTEANSLLQQVQAAQRRSNYVAPTPEPTVEDNLIGAISALSQQTTYPMSENEVRSLWNSGYDFSGYADSIPGLAQYLGVNPGLAVSRPDDSGKTLEEVDETELTNGQSPNGVMLARSGKAPMFVAWSDLPDYMKNGTAYIKNAGNGKYTLVYTG